MAHDPGGIHLLYRVIGRGAQLGRAVLCAVAGPVTVTRTDRWTVGAEEYRSIEFTVADDDPQLFTRVRERAEALGCHVDSSAIV